MPMACLSVMSQAVALRKESVDRNTIAWAALLTKLVALRKESVDRNVLIEALNPDVLSRSPQGERG